MAIDVSRKTAGISLPAEISEEIWSKTQEGSSVMNLARQVTLPGRGLEFQQITGDPKANWVNETDVKPTGKHTFGSKTMKGYTLSIIEPFSNQFARDDEALYNEIINRIPAILGRKFDETVYGLASVPGENFDTLKNAPSISVEGGSVFNALVSADASISNAEGILNGWAISPSMKSKLLLETDKQGRPLFVDNWTSTNSVPSLLGAPVQVTRSLSGSNTLGFAGDWSGAVYGVVEGINMTISNEATLTSGGETINLFQRNMFAVRFEVEVGFAVRDIKDFVRLTSGSVSEDEESDVFDGTIDWMSSWDEMTKGDIIEAIKQAQNSSNPSEAEGLMTSGTKSEIIQSLQGKGFNDPTDFKSRFSI